MPFNQLLESRLGVVRRSGHCDQLIGTVDVEKAVRHRRSLYQVRQARHERAMSESN